MMCKNSNDGLGLIHVPFGPRIRNIGWITMDNLYVADTGVYACNFTD